MTIATPLATRVAIYHRVSTLDQNPGLAREELRAAAAARGLTIAMEVEETGSGARNSRPGWQAVLHAARRGQLGCVLVWKLDRAGRSALDLLSNVEELGRCGVRFVCSSQAIDIAPHGDPMSRLLLTMLSAVSEFERSLVRERTRLGLATARKRGRRLGRRPVHVMPSHEEVAALRDSGRSWREVSKAIGCAVTTARRVYQDGPKNSIVEVPKNKGAG